jgi:integrase
MAQDCLSLEVPFGENLYVEGYVDGRYYDPRQLSRDWTSLASSLGLTGTAGKRPTFHDLRHTWATVAIYEGIDIEAVSAYMGHASVAMTADEYATALPQAKARAASVMNEVLMKDAKETPDGRLPIGNDDQEDI